MKNTKDYVSEYVNSTTKNFKDERFQDIIGQGRGIIDYKR